MNKMELRNCTMDDHFTTNAPALGFRITDFSCTFTDHQTQLLELINVDLFVFCKQRDCAGLISAVCLDSVLTLNSQKISQIAISSPHHISCMTSVQVSHF